MNKTPTRSSLKATTLALALAALPAMPGAALAAGLGKITVLSTLGQPLRAEVDISADSEELSTLKARLAPPAAFEQAGLDYPGVLSSIQVSLERRSDGRPYLALRSAQGINEPFLDLLLEMNWAAGRLQREYTFLLDPPEGLQAGPAPQVNAPQLAPPATAIPAAASSTASAPAATPQAAPAQTSDTPAPQAPPQTPPQAASAPERDAQPPQTETTPASALQQPANATHSVKPGDILSKIAQANMAANVSLDQMLVALFRSNPQAFSGNNMNRLAAGRILQLPDAESVAAIDAREARNIVMAQSADFNAYRQRLAALASQAPASEPEAPSQSARGKITPEVAEAVPAPAQGEDKLEVSRSAVAKDATAADASARRAANEEDRVAKDKALSEAQSRVQELDKNLSDMKELLALKSSGMAAAQKQAEASSAKTETRDPLKAIEEDVASADVQADDKPAAAAEVPPTDATAAPEAATTTAAPPAEGSQPSAASEAATQPAKPARKQPPLPPMEEEPADSAPSFLADNPELVTGAGGVLALLLGYLGFKQWRRRRDNHLALGPDTSGPVSQSEPSINSVFGNTVGGQIVDTGSSAMSSLETDFSVAGVDDSETSEGVDPIAEADVYMAYGRNAQAEEILLDALKTDPERHAIHLKLLEIYAARKSTKQFEGIANELFSQTQGQGEAWEQAARMGQELDPDNPLYQGGIADLAQTPVDEGFDTYNPEATMVMPPLDLGTPTTEEPAAEPPEEITESLDFELDLGSDDLASSTPAASDEALAINFDLDAQAAATEADAQPATAIEDAVALDATPERASDAPASMLEFSLDEPVEPAGSAPDEPPAEEAPALEHDMDFELDEAAPTRSAAPSLASSGIDLSAISLELNEAAADAPLPELTTPVLAEAGGLEESEASLGTELPSLDENSVAASSDEAAEAAPGIADETVSAADATPSAAADSPASAEVDTKLELANAYEEMGDLDGARELLQEVLNEGNAAQQAQAKNKLAQLG